MFTSYDKAIVALVMAVISLVSIWMGWGSAEAVTPAVPVDNVKAVQDAVSSVITVPDSIATISSILTPLLVWLVPNRR